MLAFAAPDQENGAIFLKRVSYDHRDPHIHENVRRQDRVTETARAERILSLRFGLKKWKEQTAGEFGVMQTTLEQYIAHAYGGALA